MKVHFTLLGVLFSTFAFSQEAGSLDLGFGTNGKVVTSVTNNDDKAYGVVLQQDDKLLVAGYSTSSVTGKDLTLIRYNTDGSLDASFGSGGIVTLDVQLGSDDIAYDLALQPDGKIVVAGSSDNGSDQDAFVARFDTEGALDPDFGTNGIVLTDFDGGQSDEIRVVKVHALTGNIIVGGSSIISSALAKPVVARYLPTGELDSSFETNGIRLMWINNNDDQYVFKVEDIAVLPNGKITAVGWRDFPGLSWDSDYFAARINADGSMDNTFSGNGVNIYNGGFNGHDRAYAIHLNTDNSFYMCGGGYISTLEYDFSFFEINADGTSGGSAAAADWGTFSDDRAYSLAEDMNGAFVMAGSSGSSNEKAFAVARLNASFGLDNTFSGDGKVTTTFGNNSVNEAFDMLIQSDNKIVAVGYSGEDFAIARYLGNDEAQLDAFQLQTPVDMASEVNYSTVSFNWTDAFGATSYELEVDVNSDFSTSEVFSPGNSVQSVSNLLPNTTYYWRVRATDSESFGAYSDTWSFTTNTLENFNLVSPNDGAVDQPFASIELDWTPALGAASYEVEIGVNENFTDSPQLNSVATTAFDAVSLTPLTTYYWHVRASNDGENFGEWSETWSFTTETDIQVIENTPEAMQFSIFPNPTNGNAKLKVDAQLVGRSYSIVSLSGQLLQTGTIRQVLSELNFGFEAGVYVLRVEGDGDRTIRFTLQ